jgi:hypothetical protein
VISRSSNFCLFFFHVKIIFNIILHFTYSHEEFLEFFKKESP